MCSITIILLLLGYVANLEGMLARTGCSLHLRAPLPDAQRLAGEAAKNTIHYFTDLDLTIIIIIMMNIQIIMIMKIIMIILLLTIIIIIIITIVIIIINVIITAMFGEAFPLRLYRSGAPEEADPVRQYSMI